MWSPLVLLFIFQDDGYTVTHRIITCGLSTTYIIYFSLALVYKVIIHIIGLVLAFLTRKVKVDPLNDSRYSAAIIYCSCVMLVLAVIVVFALSGVNVYAGVWTSFVLIEVCVFLGLTFIPKVSKRQFKLLFGSTIFANAIKTFISFHCYLYIIVGNFQRNFIFTDRHILLCFVSPTLISRVVELLCRI